MGGNILFYTLINVTMELLSVMLLLVLMIPILVKEQKSSRDNRFLLILFLQILCTLGDAAAWAFNGKPGLIYILLTKIGNFTTYMGGAVTYSVFLSYISFDKLSKEKTVKAHIIMIGGMYLLSFLLMVLMVLNLSNGIIYRIDQGNHYHWGEW